MGPSHKHYVLKKQIKKADQSYFFAIFSHISTVSGGPNS